MKPLHRSRTLYLALASVALSAALASLAAAADTLPAWLLPVGNAINAALGAMLALLRVGDHRSARGKK